MLAPEAPYPVAGGGALRTASLVEYLATRYRLHLIVFRQPGFMDPARLVPEGKAGQITVLDLPANSRTRAARAWRNLHRAARQIPPLTDRFAGFGRQIDAALQGRQYELGIIEHFWCAPYFEILSRRCRRVVLDLHNIESILHERCADAEGGATGLLHQFFATSCRDSERDLLPKFGEVLVTSKQDAAAIGEIAPRAVTRVYQNALPLRPVPEVAPDHAIVFSGNMEYHPNISAVQFFRSQVWPQLRERFPGLVWRLLGKNPEAVSRYTAGDPRIELVGPVDDAIAGIARSQVAVVPLLAGSGTRLKILEAWAAQVPVVSSRLGAEGLPVENGRHLLIADEAADFAESVARLLASPQERQRVGKAGRLLLEKEFTWETAWRGLDF